MEEKNVLAIGSSSGIGLEIVKTLTGQIIRVDGGMGALRVIK